MISHLETRRVEIFDTTLRDGEQTPGITLTPDRKVKIAEMLGELGVDTIEAGFPVISRGEEEAVKRIVEMGLKARVVCLARTDERDIDTAIRCGVESIHTFIATSTIHLRHKLRMTREEMLEKTTRAIEYARSRGLRVEFSAEDSTRTEIDFLVEVAKRVKEAGASMFDIADTVGTATPEMMEEYVRRIADGAGIVVSAHCHNDFGLAVANSLAAVRAGASQVHVTVNGIGERTGNTSLEEFVMACMNLYSFTTGINRAALYRASNLVSEMTGFPVPCNKAIVGKNAFGHESGIHTHGILSEPSTYEPFDPASVGRQRWLQAGKHAGRHGIEAQLRMMGIHLSSQEIDSVVRKVKEIGDKGHAVSDRELKGMAMSQSDAYEMFLSPAGGHENNADQAVRKSACLTATIGSREHVEVASGSDDRQAARRALKGLSKWVESEFGGGRDMGDGAETRNVADGHKGQQVAE